MRFLLLPILFFLSGLFPQITVGSGVRLGAGVTLGTGTVSAGGGGGGTGGSPGFTFTPATGTYTGQGTKNVTIAYSPSGSGQQIFYTSDGTPASEASTLYSTGSTIPVSATTVLNALVEQAGTVRQNTQATESLWKICAPAKGSQGTPAALACGGVGSTQPSTWTITFGTTESISVTSIGGSGSGAQMLITLGGSGCDSCTKITMNKWIKPLDNDAHIQNHEADAWHNDGPHNRLHMVGFQCNQQSGNPAQGGGLAGKQWQVDNEQGHSNPFGSSWWNTNINDKCPLSTTLWTHIIVHAHWIIGDTGCADGHTPSATGGLGCTYYDDFSVGTATSPGAPTTMTKHVLVGYTLQNDNPGWSSGCSDQDQVDINPGGTTANPFTGGVLIQRNNVTCSTQTVATGFATYTF